MARAPHIVEVSHPYALILKIKQLVLSIVLLGLLAYLAWGLSVTGLGTYGPNIATGAIGVGLFSVCLTIIFCIYYIASTSCAPSLYNYWAVISLEAAAVLFWLISFALLADITAALVSAYNAADTYYSNYDSSDDCTDYDSDGYCDYKRAVRSLTKRVAVDPATAIVYASFALATIEWILFIVSLVLFSIRVHRHRTAGLPNRPGDDRSQGYTPKQMEAQHQPMPAPEYQGQAPPPQQGFNKSPARHGPSFMTLPIEIRQKIFAFAIDRSLPVHIKDID
ncbi:hypothetical protein NA57DRAFT_73427 [Rhizodiscina lignyota]|uniref:MARVEL domain-containing protein n=1 Tax=Rhizodiscina lignyota TaxID=1504668 RepID=A0A9P4IP56_9PEZI|nr:hypothetical protein NA57DRAFT_73427 [Rhizodiscina lignyota]